MMRERFTETLKDAIRAKDTRRMSTLRLIQAAIKDRDIANRGAGKDPVSDEDILQILTKMIKQREESAAIYEENARLELAQQERDEIAIIRQFLPQQLPEEKVRELCASVISETGAQGRDHEGLYRGPERAGQVHAPVDQGHHDVGEASDCDQQPDQDDSQTDSGEDSAAAPRCSRVLESFRHGPEYPGSCDRLRGRGKELWID